jgi:hypothetical protein
MPTRRLNFALTSPQRGMVRRPVVDELEEPLRMRRSFLHLATMMGAVALIVPTLSVPAVAAGSPQAPDRSVTVASYNIHHGVGEDDQLDLDRIAEQIRTSGADIIGLQEVDRHWSSRSDFVDQEIIWLAC